MKVLTLMLLALTAVSCAHKFHPERSISSVEGERKEYNEHRWQVEPRGARQ